MFLPSSFGVTKREVELVGAEPWGIAISIEPEAKEPSDVWSHELTTIILEVGLGEKFVLDELFQFFLSNWVGGSNGDHAGVKCVRVLGELLGEKSLVRSVVATVVLGGANSPRNSFPQPVSRNRLGGF